MYRLAGSGVHKKHNTHQSTSGPLPCTIEAITRSGTDTTSFRPTGPFSPNVGEGDFSEVQLNDAERVGYLVLGHLLVQLRSHHHALLLVGVGPSPNEDGWPLAAIDRHMGHPRRKVEVVAGLGDVAML